MTVTINGTTGVSLVQDNTITSAKIVDGAVTPADTQVGSLPSMVRLNAANGFGSTATAIRRFTNVIANQGSDITYTDSTTLGATFTINTNGVYAISYSMGLNAVGQRIGISLNASDLTVSILSLTAAQVLAISYMSAGIYISNVAATVYLPAGSVIRAQDDAPAGAAGSAGTFIITRIA